MWLSPLGGGNIKRTETFVVRRSGSSDCHLLGRQKQANSEELNYRRMDRMTKYPGFAGRLVIADYNSHGITRDSSCKVARGSAKFKMAHYWRDAMFGLFRKDPIKLLRKQYAAKRIEARDLQRNGKIIEYANASAKAEQLMKQIESEEVKLAPPT
jgi:hypothetical protein